MESRQFRLKRLKTQIKLFFPLVLLLIAVFLIVLGQVNPPLLQKIRGTAARTAAPIVSVLSAPVRWLEEAVAGGRFFLMTYTENKRLRAENESLQNWRNIALHMGTEYRELKSLLNYIPPKKSVAYTARILADNGGRFNRSVMIQGGLSAGIRPGFVAMSSRGLVGRVVESGQYYSRLMLLTDYLSRLPVTVGEDRTLCMLTGDNSDEPQLTSLPEEHHIAVGDVVMTSGHVGLYPAGLGVGVVSRIDNGEIRIALFENNPNLTFVRLVDFGLSDVLLSDSDWAEK